MERDEALELLPGAYAIAIRMDEGGAGTDEIAALVGIDRSAVAALLEIGRSKLADLLATDPSARNDDRAER